MSAIDAESEPTSRDGAKLTFQKLPLKELGKRTVKEFKDDEVPELAAGVSYHAICAIPPMIIVLITLAALFDQVTSADVAGRLRRSDCQRAPSSNET